MFKIFRTLKQHLRELEPFHYALLRNIIDSLLLSHIMHPENGPSNPTTGL